VSSIAFTGEATIMAQRITPPSSKKTAGFTFWRCFLIRGAKFLTETLIVIVLGHSLSHH
jgi:hypothetical protein